jgi:hypothetical protein
MSNISRKLEQVVGSAQRKLMSHHQILPVKTELGILVGDVLIVSEGTIKNLWQRNEIVYEHVYLNAAAIKMANLLARKIGRVKSDALYRADQEYGKWFVDSQMLRTRFQQAIDSQDTERADILWARYCESRDRAVSAKNATQSLATK